MNERIWELAEQAWETIDVSAKLGLPGTERVFNKEKFAELIVRECARVDSEANNIDHIDGETYNQTILQHFGVEQ